MTTNIQLAPTEYAVTCQLCKRLVCFAKAAKAIRLIRNDGKRVWLCRRCFEMPVEEMFYAMPRDMPRRAK